jgi:hypothetical protein
VRSILLFLSADDDHCSNPDNLLFILSLFKNMQENGKNAPPMTTLSPAECFHV